MTVDKRGILKNDNGKSSKYKEIMDKVQPHEKKVVKIQAHVRGYL